MTASLILVAIVTALGLFQAWLILHHDKRHQKRQIESGAEHDTLEQLRGRAAALEKEAGKLKRTIQDEISRRGVDE